MNMLPRVFCLLIAALLLAGSVQDAEAQIWKRAKERAKKRLNERVEQKTDEAVDKTVDKAVDKGEEGIESAIEGAFARMGEKAAEEQMVEFDLGPNATGPAGAAQVQYRSATSINYGGKLGALTATLMGGQGFGNALETVTLSATHQRTDDGESSTIVDLENERFIMLYHAGKTYVEKTFDEMAEEAAAQLDAAKKGVSSQQPDDEDVDLDAQYSVTTNRTGQRESINGSVAEQILLQVQLDVSGTDKETGETGEAGIHVISDLWMTDELAGYETMQQFNQRMGEQFGESIRGVSSSDFITMMAQMGQDPRLGESVQKASDEVAKVPGMPVRSTIYLVLAPTGAEIDVEKAMQPAEEGEGGLEGLMKLAESMDESGSGEVQEQVTLLSITTQVADLQPNSDVSFEIPEDYTPADGNR